MSCARAAGSVVKKGEGPFHLKQVDVVCKKIGVSEQTYYRWRKAVIIILPVFRPCPDV